MQKSILYRERPAISSVEQSSEANRPVLALAQIGTFSLPRFLLRCILAQYIIAPTILVRCMLARYVIAPSMLVRCILVAIFIATSAPAAEAQSILPPAPEAIGGGNPLQGLGRSDDPAPPRYDQTGSQSNAQGTGSDSNDSASASSAQGWSNSDSSKFSSDSSSASSAQTNIDSQSTNAAGSAPNRSDSTDGMSSPAAIGNDSGGNATQTSASDMVPPPDHNSPEKMGSSAPNMVPPTKSKGSKQSAIAANKTILVPPPPPMSVMASGSTRVDTPSRKALALLQQGNYSEAEKALRKIVSESPLDLHSRYLLAVALVQRRKFDEARGVYQFIIEHAHDQRLKDMAESGLKKLD